jgi:hypothetical protein
MKIVATLIASLFAVSAFAADAPAKKDEAPKAVPAVTSAPAPHKTDKKAEAKPIKSQDKPAAQTEAVKK